MMKKLMMPVSAVAFLALAGAAQAECVLKDPPVLPNGATAQEAEMIAAQQAVKAYVAETQEFLSCLEFEGRGRSGGDWTRRYNDASTRMERLAAEFNKQLRAFKSK